MFHIYQKKYNDMLNEMMEEKMVSETKYNNYKAEVLPRCGHLHPKGRHAVAKIQCKP